MTIKFKDIEQFLDNNLTNLELVLKKLDDLIIKGRDRYNVPVYMTKYRIKNPKSIFLKTKRKKITDLEKITDYAGSRVLCLFEQDIYDTHHYIIKTLSENSFNLVLFRIYNWTDDDNVTKKLIINDLEKNLPDIPIKNEKKKSGYKSIHYLCTHVVGEQKYYIEIQLRTLLQDVWGELEHALSYKKGNIHPHIRKSFILLSRDLETNDSLIRHLKDISDKEGFGESFSIKSGGPVKWFDYDDKMLPKRFSSSDLKDIYNEYQELMLHSNPRDETKTPIKKARKLYKKICEKTGIQDMKSLKVRYFIKMEEAYIELWDRNIEKALKIYTDLEDTFEEHYCLHFRLGEIYFVKGEIEKSLASFDRSEELMPKNNFANIDIENRHRISLKIAFIYWLLGTEYIDFVLKEMETAKKVLDDYPDLFRDKDRSKLLNNRCWYYLEKYIIEKTDKDFEIAKREIIELERLINTDDYVSSNAFDTIAWFYYQSYLRDGSRSNLEIAKDYCKRIESSENKAVYVFLSRNIQRNHILEIMNTK